MKYQIREMTIDDINDVIIGEEKIFGESLGYDMLYSELTLNPYAYYFILEIDGKVGGYIGTWIELERAEIVNFYVDEEYQGMGFGNLIMEFVIDICESSNINNLSLEVRSSNVKAINLYKKFGLKESHIRKNYYVNDNNETEDAIVMVRTFEVK